MIKVDLITGFLGSGKTTFLLKYAKYLMDKGLRVGILEYDMGAVNVDMLHLNRLRGPKCEIEMLAAACDADCLKRRFQTKLIAMAMSGYDRVIIEPSGVFDMDQFFDPLRDDPLENFYEIGNVITIVNANLNTNLQPEERYILASQAAGAGCIVLSRTQLSDFETIEKTKTFVKACADEIKCTKFKEKYLEKDWDELTDADFNKLLSCDYTISDYVKITAGMESTFDSVCTLKLPAGLETLKDKIKELYGNEKYGKISRIKGFVRDDNLCTNPNDGQLQADASQAHHTFQVNATREDITIEPFTLGGNTAIVIGTNLDKNAILELLERH